MTTAVILSGQARTFTHCLPNLAWQVFSKLENPRFFVSFAKDADAEPAIAALVAKYGQAAVASEVVQQPLLSEPPLHLANHAPYSITPTRTAGVGPLQGILRQLWHNSRAYKFAMEQGAGECGVFVRCRADLHFHRFEMPQELRWMTPDAFCFFAFTPYWGHYGPGTNDRFALMGAHAAEGFFCTYDHLPELLDKGLPFHPETLVGACIQRGGSTITRTLLAEFAFLRKPDQQHASHWFEHMQVLPGELAEWTAHLSKQ